ncbi:MAG: hypothetical protein IJN13_02175 [Bacilli bacterium]|nr:hypothetical protein [Bacilli bacterium]
MDKKNTMLLTVIAVATLLVAVVGATFAYFTASNSATGSTTVTASTEVIGAVTLTNPTSAMSIRLSAFDMEDKDSDVPYYATTSTEKYVDEIEYQPVAKVVISGGESTTKYHCEYTMTVNGDSRLVAGDAYVTFRYPTVNNISNVTIDGVTAGSKVEIVGSKDYEVSFDAVGEVDASFIEAGFELVNRDANQNHLQGNDLTFSVNNSNGQAGSLTCTVQE